MRSVWLYLTSRPNMTILIMHSASRPRECVNRYRRIEWVRVQQKTADPVVCYFMLWSHKQSHLFFCEVTFAAISDACLCATRLRAYVSIWFSSYLFFSGNYQMSTCVRNVNRKKNERRWMFSEFAICLWCCYVYAVAQHTKETTVATAARKYEMNRRKEICAWNIHQTKCIHGRTRTKQADTDLTFSNSFHKNFDTNT